MEVREIGGDVDFSSVGGRGTGWHARYDPAEAGKDKAYLGNNPLLDAARPPP